MKRITASAILVTVLSGCDFLPTAEFSSNDQHAYLHSKNGAKLVIPASLTDSNMSDFYQLPNQTQPAKISIKPPVIRHD